MKYNKVIVAGRLTQDPDLRYTKKGTAVTNLNVATGDYQNDTIFLNVTCWGKDAENAAEYLSKGRGVIVEGQLQNDNYTTKSGYEMKKLKVNANQVIYLPGGKNKKEESNHQKPQQPKQEQQPAADDDMDVPF